MSKAFTKEDDDLPVEPSAARKPRDAAAYLTAEGAEEMRRELQDLLELRRPRLARSASSSSATQHELDLVDRRIRELQQTLLSATIITQTSSDVVQFGATVKIRDQFGDEEDYRIVSPDEIDLARNWISSVSPMAKALMNHRVGDRVSFESPAGEQVVDILEIRFGNSPR